MFSFYSLLPKVLVLGFAMHSLYELTNTCSVTVLKIQCTLYKVHDFEQLISCIYSTNKIRVNKSVNVFVLDLPILYTEQFLTYCTNQEYMCLCLVMICRRNPNYQDWWYKRIRNWIMKTLRWKTILRYTGSYCVFSLLPSIQYRQLYSIQQYYKNITLLYTTPR